MAYQPLKGRRKPIPFHLSEAVSVIQVFSSILMQMFVTQTEFGRYQLG